MRENGPPTTVDNENETAEREVQIVYRCFNQISMSLPQQVQTDDSKPTDKFEFMEDNISFQKSNLMEIAGSNHASIVPMRRWLESHPVQFSIFVLEPTNENSSTCLTIESKSTTHRWNSWTKQPVKHELLDILETPSHYVITDEARLPNWTGARLTTCDVKSSQGKFDFALQWSSSLTWINWAFRVNFVRNSSRTSLWRIFITEIDKNKLWETLTFRMHRKNN